jgi:hypothetical protein
MKKCFRIFAFIILLCTVLFPTLSASTTTDQEIAKFYRASDYEAIVKLLEQQIIDLKGKGTEGKGDKYFELYRKYLLLADIYAWRLNKTDVALLKYHELNELRRLHQEASKFPPFELLYVAEIYEVKNDYQKARDNYNNLLSELIGFREKEKDDLSILMSEDLIRFVKYQIDSLQLKTRAEKGYKPLLARLKLSSQLTHHFFPLLALGLVPTAEFISSPDRQIDLVKEIKQSPSNFSSMILNYALILAASAGSVDESSERAMEAYLLKYPESYYSLQLRYLFYKFYKESGQTKKAEKLAKELEKMASKRGMELTIGPDERFSSPEKTWETYRNALIAGDVDLAMECYVPGRRRHGKVYDALGKEKMKEIGRSMGDIHKVKAGQTMAEYMIIRKENRKEYSYAIRFQNIDGEWKMYEF